MVKATLPPSYIPTGCTQEQGDRENVGAPNGMPAGLASAKTSDQDNGRSAEHKCKQESLTDEATESVVKHTSFSSIELVNGAVRGEIAWSCERVE